MSKTTKRGFRQAAPSPWGKGTSGVRASLKGHRRPRGAFLSVTECHAGHLPLPMLELESVGSKPHRRKGKFRAANWGASIIDPMTGGCRIESGVNRASRANATHPGTRPVHRLCYHLGSDPHSNSDCSGSDGAILSQSEQIPESHWLRESAAQRRPRVGDRSGRERPLRVISGH